MQHFSLLDLSPIPEGGNAADALSNTIDLARHAEASGYHRYWLAEHHNMPGIASAASAVPHKAIKVVDHWMILLLVRDRQKLALDNGKPG